MFILGLGYDIFVIFILFLYIIIYTQERMMDMMKMNALESLMDPHMLYLDLSTGVLGSIIAQFIISGKDRFNIYNINLGLIFSILFARITTDFLYYNLVSKTYKFGGSISEFVFSIALWFILIFTMFKMKIYNALITFSSMILSMFAIARLTGWG